MISIDKKNLQTDPLSDVDFLAREFQENPYPLYKVMIKNHPIFYSDRHRQYFAFSAEAVRSVMVSNDFTVENPFRASRILFGPTVVDLDGENHRRLRVALSETINVGRNQIYRDTIIRSVITDILNNIQDGIAQDWMADLCDLLPLKVMSKIIGIPEDRFAFFKRVCEPIIAYLDIATPQTRIAGTVAINELVDYLEVLLSSLEQLPSGDETIIGSYLRQKEAGSIKKEEIIRHVSLLIPAAIDTTNRLLANCIWILCDKPDIAKYLRKAPEEVSKFVAEVIRYEPPIHTTLRFAAKDTSVLGVRIPQGSAVTVNLASASRDESVFPDPDRFDIKRKPSNRVLSFGAGKHQCVGKNLATIEICDCITAILSNFSEFQFASGTRPKIMGTAFRSPSDLMIVSIKNKKKRVL